MSQRKKNSPHITLKWESLQGFNSLNRRQLERRKGLMECAYLGTRRSRGAERSLDTWGLCGLQFQDEILHVWGEKLQCKAIWGYRSDLGDGERSPPLTQTCFVDWHFSYTPMGILRWPSWPPVSVLSSALETHLAWMDYRATMVELGGSFLGALSNVCDSTIQRK